MITEREITLAKSQATAIRDKVVSAKSTLESVNKNIQDYHDELVQLGIDVDNIEQSINDMEAKITEEYNECIKTINEWKTVLL